MIAFGLWDIFYYTLAVRYDGLAGKPFDMGPFVLCALTLGRPGCFTHIDCCHHGGGRLPHYLLQCQGICPVLALV